MWRLLPLFALLADCAPVSRDAAERLCLEEARQAPGTRGTVAIGARSGGGISTHVGIGFTAGFPAVGRDRDGMFSACVMRRSGQMPMRSYDQVAVTLPERLQ
ncbi:MAG: hypothetical protein LBE86_13330 [Gemmobacter sp.]|jgi:hypothetical protein|nr:hypothetical protein [Gemmobacter sp.]